MLNTKEMSANVGKVKPVISVGNNVVKINSIVLSKTPYDEEACNIHLNVETKPVDGDFVGFLEGRTLERTACHGLSMGFLGKSTSAEASTDYPRKDVFILIL